MNEQHWFLILSIPSQNIVYILLMTRKTFMRVLPYSTIPFFPPAVSKWNNLPLKCRNSDSANSFKHSMNEGSLIVPNYFNSIGVSRIFLTRLRTICRALNNALFLKRNCDSPFCRCGDIKNAFTS